MANNYLTLILITFTYMVFGHKSINFHVKSEIQHHIRHLNHHHHQHQQQQQQQQQQHSDQVPLINEQNPNYVENGNSNGDAPIPNPLEQNNSSMYLSNLWSILDHRRILQQNLSEDDPSDTSSSNFEISSINKNLKFLLNPIFNGNNNNNDDVGGDNDADDVDDVADDDANEQIIKKRDDEFSKIDRSESKSNIKCPKCSGTTNVRVSEEELIELRIEFVKNQILQKLRLKERPQVTIGELPQPIYEGATIHGDEKAQSRDLDDYYARTSQKFIFLEQERTECDRVSENPSICFSFKIDGDIDSMDVSTAELWLYKRSSPIEGDRKQTLVVSELDQGNSAGNSQKYLTKAKPIAIQSVESEASWVKIDIAWPIKKWFGNHELSHIIQITCQSCEMDRNESLLSVEKDHRPFILIDTLNRRKIRRPKRSVNCSAGVTECCREKLYISFAEIGWNDWILHPPGYDAYFCRGSCSTAASITMSNSHYSTVLRKVIYQRETSGRKPLELIPCCTAKQFSSLQLMYLDSNKTGTVKTLPNMVVKSCGCM